MFRSFKVPIIALLVAVAFTCYVFGPGRFRTEKVAVRVRPSPKGADVFGLLSSQPFALSGPAMPRQRAPRKEPPIATADEQYSGLLGDLQQMARRAKLRRAANQSTDAEVRAIRADKPRLEALQEEVALSFQAIAQHLYDQKLPDTLVQRSNAAQADFSARASELDAILQALVTADEQRLVAARSAALERLAAFFDTHHQGPAVHPLDPSRLPFRPATPNARSPATSPAELPDHLRLGAIGRSASLAASGTTTDPNLAPTQDVQITQAIKDLAASQGNSPVQIFNWVRNNVVWLPTYGSVQGSAVTLATRRGNAFDSASLLIALYRAAGIPARYVYGTIEVPADRMSNWAGGILPLAAQQLMGQGGIPSVAVAGGGAIGSLRLEHVWVEAFVDFVPSRGAINKKPDTWVQLDPSFKQYRFTAPIDLKTAVPVDVQNTARDVAAPALVDPVHQSLTGFDQGTLDLWTAKMGEDLEFAYGHFPDPARFTGGRTIVADQSTVLPGSLPNRIVARMATWSELPDSLRHKVSMTLYGGSPLERALGGPQMTYQVSLPAIAGRRLGVTYVPASDADAAALASFRSAPGNSIPVYLLQVQPSIRLDDTEVARGPSAAMGSLQGWDAGLIGPGDPAPDVHTYDAAAGDELVFGIDAQGISQDVIHQRFLQRASDTAAENLFTVALYYWGQYDVLAQSVATARNATMQRLPSIGLFSSPLRVGYFFGIPRTGYYGSRQMDVAHSIFAVADNNGGDTIGFERASGMIGSLLEGRTFDNLFGGANGTGVSAVQLLREANEQQIPIFQVTGANHATIAPQLQLRAEVLSGIADAVAAGKTVLVPQRAPVHGNWSGVGYIVEDPATGAAAYLIDGGANGGADDPCDPERQKEPVRVPVTEILIVLLIVILLILLIIFMPEIIAFLGGLLGGLGQLAPAAAALLLVLGLAATPSTAEAAPPPPPGQGLLPPGDCTPAQYAVLAAAVQTICKSGPGCKSTDCGVMRQALTRLQDCAAARQALNDTCFRGGDQAHIDELLSVLRGVANCTCRIARLCP